MDRGQLYGERWPGKKSGGAGGTGHVRNRTHEAGGTPQSLEVTADVELGADKEAGGFRLTGIKLTVRGEVEGLDEAGFKDAAAKAKESCPISKALTGVEITLDAALES